jgi:hypothetical protein
MSRRRALRPTVGGSGRGWGTSASSRSMAGSWGRWGSGGAAQSNGSAWAPMSCWLLLVVVGKGKLVRPVDFARCVPDPPGPRGPCRAKLTWLQVKLDRTWAALCRWCRRLPPPLKAQMISLGGGRRPWSRHRPFKPSVNRPRNISILRTEFKQLCHRWCRNYKAPHRRRCIFLICPQ